MTHWKVTFTTKHGRVLNYFFDSEKSTEALAFGVEQAQYVDSIISATVVAV